MDRCTGRHCRPVLQLPTGESSSLQTVVTNDDKLLALTDDKLLALTDPGAHGNEQGKQTEANERGKANLNGGKMLRRAVGMAGKDGSRHTARRTSHCRRTQPADSPPGTGLKTNERPTVGRPCSKHNNSCRRRRLPAVQCR